MENERLEMGGWLLENVWGYFFQNGWRTVGQRVICSLFSGKQLVLGCVFTYSSNCRNVSSFGTWTFCEVTMAYGSHLCRVQKQRGMELSRRFLFDFSGFCAVFNRLIDFDVVILLDCDSCWLLFTVLTIGRHFSAWQDWIHFFFFTQHTAVKQILLVFY